jgi:hypothetical protein
MCGVFVRHRPSPGWRARGCRGGGLPNRQLCQALDAQGASGRLNEEIGGKVYVGKLGGHAHAHPH